MINIVLPFSGRIDVDMLCKEISDHEKIKFDKDPNNHGKIFIANMCCVSDHSLFHNETKTKIMEFLQKSIETNKDAFIVFDGIISALFITKLCKNLYHDKVCVYGVEKNLFRDDDEKDITLNFYTLVPEKNILSDFPLEDNVFFKSILEGSSWELANDEDFKESTMLHNNIIGNVLELFTRTENMFSNKKSNNDKECL